MAMFVAVGYTEADVGQAMSSPDGITWTMRTISDRFWLDVIYDGTQFVALAFDTAVATSPDGITWTEHLTGIGNEWTSVAWTGTLYVAVGEEPNPSTLGCVMTSPDAITWTLQGDVDTNLTQWFGVVSDGTTTVVSTDDGGDNRVITSTNGVAWTIRLDAPNYGWWFDLAYGAGLFVNVGAEVTTGTPGAVRTSPDGITWTQRTCPDHQWYGAAYDTYKSLFIVVAGDAGSGAVGVMTSPDGITWTERTPAAGNYFAVTEGDPLAVAVGSGVQPKGDIMSSPDGITWTARTSPSPDDGFWWSVAFMPGDGPTPPPDPDPDYPPDHVPYPGRSAWASAAPVDGTTWLYDGSTGFWSMLKSEQISRHRVQFSFQVAGQTIGCDYFNGKLYRITDQAYSDNGKMIEGEIIGETVTMGPDESFLTVNKLRVQMETGVGNTVAPGDNPQVALSIARDSGAKDFGPEMWKPLGQTGEVYTRLEWRRLGTTRYFTPRIRVTDPVKRVIVSASVNPPD